MTSNARTWLKRASFALLAVGGLAAIGVAVWNRWNPLPVTGPPPRATQVAHPQAQSSTIVVPVSANLSELEQLLDHEIPVDLWTIDQPGATCVAPQHISLFGKKLAITPKMQCHIVGSARRGAITLHGMGRDIIADVPILAHVEAKNVGGLVSAHADGQAMAHARIRVTIAHDWRASGTVALSYDWTSPPAIMLLGQRIAFTDKADARLKPVVAGLERKLPDALSRLNLRAQIATLWQRGFAVINLNDRAPAVWMRIEPQKLFYGGYAITGNRLQIRLGVDALTQAVVGPRPAAPAPVPLPDMSPAPADVGQVRMFVPVIADYAELTPVIARALARRQLQPFNLPGIGPVDARFANIEVYGATGGRIVVGADIVATPRGSMVSPLQGRIWFAAVPHNSPGSQIVHFTRLTVAGTTNSPRDALLVAVVNNGGFSDAIAGALTQNFTHDYENLLGKIQHAVASRQQGVLHIDAHVQSLRNDALEAYADGLYMPVQLTGQASITYVPDANLAH